MTCFSRIFHLFLRLIKSTNNRREIWLQKYKLKTTESTVSAELFFARRFSRKNRTAALSRSRFAGSSAAGGGTCSCTPAVHTTGSAFKSHFLTGITTFPIRWCGVICAILPVKRAFGGRALTSDDCGMTSCAALSDAQNLRERVAGVS